MRANVGKLLVGLAVGAASTGPATAEEQLVMPFACRVEGGTVLLAPSAPQAHSIYGRHERKRMRTCSPYDRRKCHTWFVHRFDLDCGGVKTSWQSVVAALGPMFAETSRAPGDAAPPGQASPYRSGPGPRVAFPPGFAPNPMKIAQFKRTKPAPATAQIPPPPKKPDDTTPAQVAESEPSSEAKAADKTARADPKATKVAARRALKIEIENGSGEVTGSLPGSSGSLWRDAAAVFALMLGGLLVLSGALLLRRRKLETMPVPLARSHEPVTRHPHMSNAGLEGASAHRQQQSDAPATRLRLWDEDWLPGTMSEALDVLGVDPHAGRDMMKTTVTRLRRALHPDYALDEEDRRLRERRLKQINVAWEIVSGKRRALFLSVKPRTG